MIKFLKDLFSGFGDDRILPGGDLEAYEEQEFQEQVSEYRAAKEVRLTRQAIVDMSFPNRSHYASDYRDDGYHDSGEAEWERRHGEEYRKMRKLYGLD